MPDTKVIQIPSRDPRLGRHIVHDPRSRGFPRDLVVDKSTWHTATVSLYDPRPNPNQKIGDCTGCAKAMQFNARGNRIPGVVLGMTDADRIYSLATSLDPFPGQWPPTDTGSSGLGASKAAQQLGYGGEYRWLFGGADEVVQAVMAGEVVNVGTRWDNNMFNPDRSGRVHLGGGVAGGHEWAVRGYDVRTDELIGRCWWGSFRDFRILRADLQTLLDDEGDAHVQDRLMPTAA